MRLQDHSKQNYPQATRATRKKLVVMDLAKNNFNRMEFLGSKQCNFGKSVDDSNPHFVRGPDSRAKPKIEFKSNLRGFVTP